MINVSNEFKEVMQQRRDFHEAATVTLLSGTVLNLTEDDFTVKNNGYTEGASDNCLPLGVAIGRTASLEIWNGDGAYSDYDFFGATIILNLTFQLSETVETVKVGTFVVAENPQTRGDTIIITAHDAIVRADKPYTSTLSYPATITNIWQDACTNCGLAYETQTITNGTFKVREHPGDGITYREVMGYCAMLAGGNAIVNRNGKAQIKKYASNLHATTNANRHELTDWINPPEVDVTEIYITGIKTTAHVDGGDDQEILSGQEGYVLMLENPFFSGKEQEAVDLIANVMVGKHFSKFKGDHTAYPLAEFMDQAKITHRGKVYYSFLTDIDFQWFGRTTFANSAAPAVRAAGTYKSPENSAVVMARDLVYQERTARESAMAALNDMVQNGAGLYSTDIEQGDGSTIRYLHDKPSLEESLNVIKVTSEAIGFSTDGGATYPFGIEISGDVIANLLSVVGVNADWINAGSISVGRVSGLDDLLDPMREEYGDFINTVLQYMDFDATNGLTIAAIGSAICSRLTNSGWQLLAAGRVVQQVDAEDGAQFSSLTLAAINSGDVPVLNLGNLQICVETDGSITGRKR